MEISRPDGLVDIADLGLTLAEAKLVLAGVQREIVAAQARDHAVRRPGCRRCEGVCRVKDYRQHAIATLFGQVAVRLPRFRCAGCGTTGTGVQWPPYARSTPELDRLRAQLSALLTYRTAAALLGQMFPVDAGQDPETWRRHTFKIAKTLSMTSAAEAPVSVDAKAIVVTLDSTFIRSCEDGERHLEVRIGNVETEVRRTTGFWRCREGQHGHWGADPPRPRRRRQDRGHLFLPPSLPPPHTALTAGTANFLVNRRMNKSQQMRWTRRGADRLLQVRCAVYNGTLGTGFGQRFQAANDRHLAAAIAA